MTSVRPARLADARAMARVYNEGVEERQATLETRRCSAADFAERIGRAGRWPTIVAEDDGRVVGWAAVGEYNPRECYRGVGEATVYVERAARRRGIGRGLLEEPAARRRGIGRGLLEELAAGAERAGYWKLVGRLFPENEPSRALLRSCGFSEVGVHRRHGRLDGDWRDVLVVERLLGEAAGEARRGSGRAAAVKVAPAGDGDHRSRRRVAADVSAVRSRAPGVARLVATPPSLSPLATVSESGAHMQHLRWLCSGGCGQARAGGSWRSASAITVVEASEELRGWS
jgi:L-amino acid N-acyltransferase YncA